MDADPLKARPWALGVAGIVAGLVIFVASYVVLGIALASTADPTFAMVLRAVVALVLGAGTFAALRRAWPATSWRALAGTAALALAANPGTWTSGAIVGTLVPWPALALILDVFAWMVVALGAVAAATPRKKETLP